MRYNADEPEITSLVEMKLHIEKPFFDDLVWLAEQINDSVDEWPKVLAEVLLQVAIENTVNDPGQVDEWVSSFRDKAFNENL